MPRKTKLQIQMEKVEKEETEFLKKNKENFTPQNEEKDSEESLDNNINFPFSDNENEQLSSEEIDSESLDNNIINMNENKISKILQGNKKFYF